MTLVEIKNVDALISNKPFFYQPVKHKEEVYEKLVEIWRNDGYTARNLLDYLYYQNSYQLIRIDLSRQTNKSIPQQIKFTRKLADDGATMFFIVEKQQKYILNFPSDSLIVTE